MRATRNVVVSSVLVLLLVIAFWLGRITTHGDKAEHGSHEEAPKAMKSSSEAAPHEHTANEPPGQKAGEKPSGLTLTADQKANIGLKTVTADLRAIENVIRVAGVVRPHPDREAQVSSRVSGKVVGLFFKVGDAVQRGQRLAEVQSAEIQKVQVDLMQAENKLTLAKAELERIQNLVESKIAARKELIAAQNQHQSVLNEIQGLEQQLTILGLTEAAVKKMREQKTIATFSVAAPMGGVIASVVFVEGDAFEESLRELKVGQSVRIRLASYPDEVFAGKISRLSPTIDPQKRTLRLWVEVVNPSGKLKPNLFSEMNIVLGGQGEVLAIPQEAHISTEGESFVFVEEKGSFRRADVVLGARDDRFVEVKKGLLPGDRVVTDGKQQLYTQSLIARQGGAALGGHTH